MKKYIALALIFISFFSCTEDVDLLAPYREVVIVNAMLDKSDSAHYVIIQKGYINPDQDALELASNPDSIYFQDLDVKVEERNSSGNVLNTFVLEKVDLTNEGFAKSQGNFATNPNYAYKFKANLKSNNIYRLVIKKDQKEFIMETGILNVDSNTLGVLPKFWVDSFQDIPVTATFSPTIIFRTGEASMYTGFLEIPYFEVNSNNPKDTVKKSIRWSIVENAEVGELETLKFLKSLANLKEEIKAQMPLPEANVTRYLGLMTFNLYGGSDRLLKYIQLNQAKGGLAAGQVTPEFQEGILTEDTYGLFTTRGQDVKPYQRFTDSTYSILFFSEDMTDLRIRGLVE